MQVNSLYAGLKNFLELRDRLSEEDYKILEKLHISMCELKEVKDYSSFRGYMKYVQSENPHIDYDIIEDTETEFKMEFKIADTKHIFHFVKPEEEKK